jgi:methionine--tRNA ligase beta chain
MKKDTISIDTFAACDIRVGEVLSVEAVDGSDKLLALQVDLGEDYGIVEILSGIHTWYEPTDLTGKKLLFIANLDPRPMMGRVSHGMMMAADGTDRPVLLSVDPSLANGSGIR